MTKTKNTYTHTKRCKLGSIALQLRQIWRYQKVNQKPQFKGEQNQLMIWGFTEFRTNKKIKILLLMKILQGLMLKHVYILLILKFPLNIQAAIFPFSVIEISSKCCKTPNHQMVSFSYGYCKFFASLMVHNIIENVC